MEGELETACPQAVGEWSSFHLQREGAPAPIIAVTLLVR
jgi:hypothetical protein